MMPLCARNVIIERFLCARHILEDFALKKNKAHAETGLLAAFYFQVVAALNFCPMVFSNFFGRRANLHILCLKLCELCTGSWIQDLNSRF